MMLRLIALVALTACASFESQRSRAGYESHLWSQMHERTLVSQGRNLANVRWLVLNQEHFAHRVEMLGHDDALTTKFKAGDQDFLLVALQMKPGSQFAKSDFKVFWNELELPLQGEVASNLEMRSLYPFAYPFHRVFWYAIPRGSPAKVTVWTPWGKLEDENSRP